MFQVNVCFWNISPSIKFQKCSPWSMDNLDNIRHSWPCDVSLPCANNNGVSEPTKTYRSLSCHFKYVNKTSAEVSNYQRCWEVNSIFWCQSMKPKATKSRWDDRPSLIEILTEIYLSCHKFLLVLPAVLTKYRWKTSNSVQRTNYLPHLLIVLPLYPYE